MIAFAVVTLSALTLAGFAALFYALNHVVDGYEDENGFHRGLEPARVGIVETAMRFVPTDNTVERWNTDSEGTLRPQHTAPRIAGVC